MELKTRPVGPVAAAWTRALTRMIRGGRMIWRLEGYDTFDCHEYPIGTLNVVDGHSTVDGARPFYDNFEEALADARKQLASLEHTQPSASSGGQGFGGIQDHVYIVHPDGRRERVWR